MNDWGVLIATVIALAAIACCSLSRAALRRIRVTSLVFDHTDMGILVANANGDIVAVNRAYCDITGYTQSELIGRNPRMQQSGRHDEGFYRELWQTLNSTGQWQGEIWNRRKSGTAYPVWENISAVKA